MKSEVERHNDVIARLVYEINTSKQIIKKQREDLIKLRESLFALECQFRHRAKYQSISIFLLCGVASVFLVLLALQG